MFKLVLANLSARPWMSFLSILLIALSVALMSLLSQISAQIEAALSREAKGIDLVVGAKGSPLQLVLAGVYQLDVPPGNIPLASLEKLKANRLIAHVIPLAMGDSFRGFRIVGSDEQLLRHYSGRLAQGEWSNAPMSAVIGASVAAQTGLVIGAQFSGAHGLSQGGSDHHEHPYKVTGVLAPTQSVLDRMILTPIESIWHAHDKQEAKESEQEITMALLRYASPIAAVSLPKQINATADLQAASPAFEAARLLTLAEPFFNSLTWLASAILMIGSLSIFAALAQAIGERRDEIAMLRLLGAAPFKLFTMLCAEGLILSALGVAMGLALSHLSLYAISWWPTNQGQWRLVAAPLNLTEGIIAAASFSLGLVASAMPAWRASRANPLKLLEAA